MVKHDNDGQTGAFHICITTYKKTVLYHLHHESSQLLLSSAFVSMSAVINFNYINPADTC